MQHFGIMNIKDNENEIKEATWMLTNTSKDLLNIIGFLLDA